MNVYILMMSHTHVEKCCVHKYIGTSHFRVKYYLQSQGRRTQDSPGCLNLLPTYIKISKN